MHHFPCLLQPLGEVSLRPEMSSFCVGGPPGRLAHACEGCARRLPVEPRAAQPSRMVSMEMEPPSKPSTGKLICSPSRRTAST